MVVGVAGVVGVEEVMGWAGMTGIAGVVGVEGLLSALLPEVTTLVCSRLSLLLPHARRATVCPSRCEKRGEQRQSGAAAPRPAALARRLGLCGAMVASAAAPDVQEMLDRVGCWPLTDAARRVGMPCDGAAAAVQVAWAPVAGGVGMLPPKAE